MILITDAAAQCVYLSSDWRRLTGQRTEDGLGRCWLARVHPDDRVIVENILDDARQHAVEFNVRYRLLKPDDTCRWVGAGGVPSFGMEGNTFLGHVGTITELASGASDTISAYGTIERFRPPVPHPTTMPSGTLDLIADHLIIAHSLIETGSGDEALNDVRRALFKVGQALAARITQATILN